MAKNLPIYDGDSLFLYCSESAGHLYCEPQRYLRPNLITVCTASDDKKSSFPNIEFAAFTVSQIKQKSFVKFDQLPLAGGGNEGHTSSSGDPMTIVYGSAVKLRHKVSNKYLSITTSKPLCLDSNADPDECIFHLVSPTQEKGWGEDLTLNCLVKFESVKYKGYRIQCVYNTMEASYRLVLSATGSVFSLKPHCHKRALLNSKSINGGSVIMLASIKVDGYISATGSFANEHLLDEFKSKHRVGLRRWHKEFYKVIPYSGDTYLQIEKLIDLNSGSPFMYGEECRIKHIPTQQYITFFGTSDGFEISLQSLQTSCDHELFRILSVDNSMTEQTQLLELDKIVLQHVKSEKMLSIYVKPVLQKNIHTSHHSPRSQWFHLTLDDIGEQTASKSIFQVLKVEDSAIADVYDISGIISSFCSILQKTDQQISDKIYESHLRCFKSLLNKSHEQKNGKRLTNMFRIFQGVDAMISILMKNKHNKNNYKVCESICSALEKYIGVCNKKSRMYMTKGEILDALFDMIGEGFGIKTVLIALCKDDVDIRDQLEEKMSSLIEQTDTHDHDIAELMTTLAFNKRRHSREIQNLIYRKTLESGMIHDFPEVKFVLEEFVLRCEYLEQIGIAADRQPYTFNYDSLSVYLSQQEKLDDDDLQKIEENIRQYLLSSEIDGRIVLYYTRSSEYKDRNSIIAQMLGVLVFLIDYGFYHNKETKAKEMINILIKILDGSTDSYDRPNSNERDYSSESKIIFKIKLMSLHCLQLFLKRHCYTSLKKLLYDYKVLNNDAPKMTTDNDDSQDDSQDGAIKLNQVAIHTSEGCDIVGPVYDPPHKKMMDLSLSIEPITEELTKISQERLRYNFRNSHYQVFDVSIYSHQNKKLCDILIDLMNYEDPEICLMSAELLYDMHSIETTLLSVAERVYFYSNDDDQHNLSGMLDISTMTDEEQLLKKMLKRKVDDVPKLLKKLKEFSALCVSANEEPNPFYQGVAYSCGLFNILLEYILEYGNSNYFDQEEIMSNCCLLLQSISRKYPSAQKRLFASLHDLMNVNIAVTPMVYLLNEIFIENPLLCECLTEGDIKQMFYIATSSSNPEHFELTVTLETILRAINASTPMKEYIIQLFSEMWEDNLGHIYGANNKNFKLNLLKSPESDEANLNLLLNSSDLLATCTEGEGYSAESLVSLFFPITDLLEIISCDEIVATHHKLPFARILTWTYLNTDRDSLAACSQLASSDLFWSHLEDELSIIDDKVLKSITFLNPQQRADLHTKMNILYKFSWSINGWIKFCSDVDVENFDDFNGNLLYVVKGLIPLLSAFCHEISSHMSGVNDKCRSLLTPLKIGIIEGLRHKLSELENCIHNNARFSKDLHYCLVNVTLLCGGSIEQPKTKEFRPTCILPPVARENDANINFQMYIKRYLQAYSKSHDNSKSQDAEYICKSIAFPSGPSFNKLIQLFSDSDEDLRNSGNLKIKKLVKFLDIHINKQNRQGIRSLERASLERITLLTLQLICGVVFERISKVSEVLRPKDFQRQYTDTIHPIQEVLLDERIVEILFLLLIHPKDEIPFQVLACLNVLLYPGNEEAKKKISLLVNHQINHELFYVVHQLLRKAQSFLNWKNIQNVLAQILITEPDAPAGFQPVQRARKLASVPVINKWSRSGLFRQPSAELQKKEKNTVMVASIQTISQQTELDMLLQQQEEITNVEDFEEKFDFRQIILGLNVLSWLCDGQQKEIQDILRQKKMLTVGINIVSQVTFFLHGILSDKHLIENNLVVLQSALQSLIEMCAGNYNNQLIAFKGQVIRSINKIVQLETIANDKIYKLKSSSIELLEIMLEETNENSNQLAQWIINYLNIIDLLNVMFQLWENQPKWFSSELDHEKWRNRLFRAYHILRRVADYKNVTVDFLVDYKKHSNECKFAQHFDSHKDEAGKMWQYCHIWSKSIEVVYKGAQNETGILTRVYFHCNPHKNLNEIEKNTVLTHIKRNTPQEKLYDLLKWIQALRDTYTWRKKVKKHWLPHMLLKATVVRQFITSLLIIILNLFVLFGLEAPPTSSTQIGGSCTGDNSTEFQCNDTNTSTTLLYFQPIIVPSSPFWYDPLIYSVGSIHLLFAIWMITQYFIKHWCDISFDIPIFKRIIYNTKKGLLRRKYILSFFKYLNKIFCCGHIRARRPQPEKYFQLFFFSFEPLYRLLFVLFSALGLVSSGYFYCGCIIYLFLRNQVLLYILKAVKKSAIQLITVFVLGFVITYIYAVFSFAIMSNYFDPQRDMFCNTLFQCFVTISRLGFLETLGIDIPVRPSVSHPPSFGVLGFRIIYDLVFFIVVTIIGLNIVVAILVDKFSEIRDDRDKIDVDNQTRCFICSIKKDEFETNGKSFLKHYHNDHHLWNYFNFIVYLDKIHPNDRNALEKYIFSQVPSKNNPTGSIDFFPLFKAKILEKNAVENAFESDDDYDE